MSNHLLPHNATNQEIALSETVERSSNQQFDINSLFNADTCPENVLPWLAWAVSVDEWNSAWSEQQKRATIKSSFLQHSTKGTIGAVRNKIESLGYDVTINEWFIDPAKMPPYTFDVIIDIAQQPVVQDIFNQAKRLIFSSKNTRSHLAKLRVITGQDNAVSAGIAQEYGILCATGGSLEVLYNIVSLPNYWYAQFNVSSTSIQAIGLAVDSTTVSSSADIAYPIYLNNYVDANNTSDSSSHWYQLNANSNDSSASADGTDTAITYSGGGADFNGSSSRIVLSTSQLSTEISSIKHYRAVVSFSSIPTTSNSIVLELKNQSIKIFCDYKNRIISAEVKQSNGAVRTIEGFGVIANTGKIYVVDLSIRSNSIVLYVNGRIVGSNSDWDGTFYSTSTTINDTFGANSSASGNFLHGKIYDLKTFNAEKTDQQVRDYAISIGLYGLDIKSGESIAVWNDSSSGVVYSSFRKTNFNSRYWYEFNNNYDSTDTAGTIVPVGVGATLGADSVYCDQALGKTYLLRNSGNIGQIRNATMFVTFSTTVMTSTTYRYIAYYGSANTDYFGFCIRIKPNTSRIVASVCVNNGGANYDLRFQDSTNYYEFTSGEIVTASVSFNDVTGLTRFCVNGVVIEEFIAVNFRTLWFFSASNITLFNMQESNFSSSKGFTGTIYDAKIFWKTLTSQEQIAVNNGSTEFYIEYTSVTDSLKPAVYDSTHASIDATSTILNNPDTNNWQPYGA